MSTFEISKRLIFSAFCLAAMLGCGRVHLDFAAGGRSVYIPVENLPDQVEVHYHPTARDSAFEIRTRAHWIIWTLPLNHPNWDTLMRGVLEDGDGLGNLTVTTRTGALDILVGAFTLGFYRTTRIIVVGDRIRLSNAAEETDAPRP